MDVSWKNQLKTLLSIYNIIGLTLFELFQYKNQEKRRFLIMKTAKEFEEAFDNNKDIDDMIDWSKATRPNFEQKRVNLDLPKWMIEK